MMALARCKQDGKNPRKNVPDALPHHSDRGTPPDEAAPDWDNSPSFYCFNFLTQRGNPVPGASLALREGI
jgi:hypothetical protein